MLDFGFCWQFLPAQRPAFATMPAAKRAGYIITAAATTSTNAVNHLIAAVAGQLSPVSYYDVGVVVVEGEQK